MKKLGIGIDNFKKLIDKNCYFVDKTNLIKSLIDGASEASLYTRPRRFGKTLNMSMIKYFFEDERDSAGNRIDNSYLFKGLAIENAGEDYLNEQGKYPVISISFKETKAAKKEDSYTEIKNEISNEFKRFRFILNEILLDEEETEKFNDLCRQKTEISRFRTSIKFLSECLYKYYGKKAIILVDEYDVPLENAFRENYYNEMSDFIRSFFSSAFKGNDYLEFGVITGCLRISKESIFTGMNNLYINSILSDEEENNEFFGFTENEVDEICRYYNMENSSEVLKEWYNGYIFGETKIYNPWDILNFAKARTKNLKAQPKPYWSNSSGNEIIKELLKHSDSITKCEIESLIHGGTIKKRIHEDITYEEVYNNMTNLWNFLFFTGYLKNAGVLKNGEIKLKIPNKEILETFKNHISEWLDNELGSVNRENLYNAVLNKNDKEFEKIISTVLFNSVSFYDTRENFFHGLMLGLLTGIKNYTIDSNRESGSGRYDLALIPVFSENPVVIFEFKITDNEEKLEEKAEEALNQIEKNGYEQEFIKKSYKKFIKFGIVFYKKRCCVKCR